MNKESCVICKQYNIIVEHHIKSRCYGGSNKPYNKVKICPTCHSLVHYGEIIIEGYYYCAPNGNTLIYRKKGEESITGMPDPKVWLYKRGDT